MLFIPFTIQCQTERTSPISINQDIAHSFVTKEKLQGEILKQWYIKDIVNDTIPGISLDRAYEKIGDKTLKKITVAVIDTEMDINHEDLLYRKWINSLEVPNNGLDDDLNGYIDDVNGWNFIGNEKGENLIYSHTASAQFLRYYQNNFKNITDSCVVRYDENYKEFLRAKHVYDSMHNQAIDDLKYGNFLVDTFPVSKNLLKTYFPKEDYNVVQLDSLYSLEKSKKGVAKLIYYMRDYLKYGLTLEYIYNYKFQAEEKIQKTFNLDFNDREILGDDPNDLKDTRYGNNIVNGNLDELYHGTMVAGLIGANRYNNIGIDGVLENVQLMSVCISSNGAEYDKDISLAIRYAVDNGANIINMSFGKEFSIHNDWVLDAIKYAADNNVLIVSSAGNSTLNLNKVKNYYPNDNVGNNTEVANNFILVGSSSHRLGENLLSYFSNYGNMEVDIFAPGEDIFTTIPYDNYRYNNGTSLSSAITTGVAALVWSFRPDLKAENIKLILLQSALKYEGLVEIKGGEMASFDSLSKSGGILNAYNAILMAERFTGIQD